MKKRVKKIAALLGAFAMVVSCFTGFGNVKAVKAAGETVNFYLYKGAYDTTPTNKANTGTKNDAWHTDNGGTPQAGAGFTVYDVSQAYETLTGGGKTSQEAIDAIAADQTLMTEETKVGDEVVTGNDGQAAFKGLSTTVQIGGADKDATYMFVETTMPQGVTQKSKNLVVHLPVYKIDDQGNATDETLSDIYLYPKNETLDVSKDKEDKDDFTINEPIEFTINFKVPSDIDDMIKDENDADIPSYNTFYLADKSQEKLTYVDDIGIFTQDGKKLDESQLDYRVATAVPDADKEEVDDTAAKDSYINQFNVYFNTDENSVAPNVEKLKAYADQTLIFKYTMKLNAGVVPDTWTYNGASLTFDNQNTDGKSRLPWDYENVITYGATFKKINSDNGNALAGAVFVVGRNNGDAPEYLADPADGKNDAVWTTDINAARKYTSAADGVISIEGLEATVSHTTGEALTTGSDKALGMAAANMKYKGDDQGSLKGNLQKGNDVVRYFMHEVKAPTNFVKLAKDTEFTVDYSTWTDTGKGAVDLQSTTQKAYEIANAPASKLPGTGGAGVVGIIVLGTAIIAGVVVYFIKGSKKREI